MAFDQAQIGVKLAHLVVRDQLSICRYFANKVEFEAEKNNQKSQSQEKQKSKEKKKDGKKSTVKKIGTSSFDEEEFDEIFDEDQSRDLFFEDDEDKISTDALNESVDSTGNFQTEQAFNNNLDGAVSIVERSGRLLK